MKSLPLPFLQRQGKQNGYPSFGRLLFFLITHLGLLQHPQLVSGFSCYECTSEQAGCEQKMTPSEAVKFGRVCEGGAIGCAVYDYEMNFLLPTIFHRGCAYPVDMEQYQWYSTGNEPKGERHFILDPTTLAWWNLYDAIIERWNDTRKATGYPPPAQVRNYPREHGPFRYFFLDASKGEFSNSISLTEWRKTWKDTRSAPPKRQESIECYSCEAELGETEMKFYFHAGKFGLGNEIERMPACSDMKTVTCRNVYGCATVYLAKHPMDEDGLYWWRDTKYRVSRIWRGCWAPGEMKCILNDWTKDGRSLHANNSKVKSRQDDSECGNAYLRSYIRGKGEVAWGGYKYINQPSHYKKYLDCKQRVRSFVRVEQDGDQIDSWRSSENPYATVQYRFCGPKAKCNRDESTPEEKEDEDETEVKEGECENEDGDFDGNEYESCNCKVTEDKDETNTAQFSKWTSNTSKTLWILVTASIVLPHI